MYGAETWGSIDSYKEKILLLERKALTRCLGVKPSTSNDLLYIELNRADMLSTIKDRQHKFFKKILELEENEAMVKNVIRMCAGLGITRYYGNLNGKHREKDLMERKRNAVLSDASETMIKRYVELTDNKYCDSIYEYNMREDLS